MKEKAKSNRRRGKLPSGEKHWNTLLTEEEVKLIRSFYKTGKISQQRLGKRFEISQAAVCAIINGKSWKHV